MAARKGTALSENPEYLKFRKLLLELPRGFYVYIEDVGKNQATFNSWLRAINRERGKSSRPRIAQRGCTWCTTWERDVGPYLLGHHEDIQVLNGIRRSTWMKTQRNLGRVITVPVLSKEGAASDARSEEPH